MATKLKQMKGKEFIRKILAGERDFSRIKLEKEFDLSGHKDFKELQHYLRSQDLSKTPIHIEFSDLSFVKARELHLPYVRGMGADLNEADLWIADLHEADLKGVYFEGANLDRVNLYGANLWIANLDRVNLNEADLGRVNLEAAQLGGANLYGARLGMANLKGAHDLENVCGLEHMIFFETRVTPKQEIIIKEALARKRLFIVEE